MKDKEKHYILPAELVVMFNQLFKTLKDNYLLYYISYI